MTAQMAQTVSESNAVVTEPEPSTATISGGHLVAKALKAEGIAVIFTLCGGHIIDIYDGCVDEGIAVVDVRHEQVAAHAADGYARMTGKPGCAVVTAGPGTTDAVTGVAKAFRESYNVALCPSFLAIPRDFLDNSLPVEQATISDVCRYPASTKSIGDPA